MFRLFNICRTCISIANRCIYRYNLSLSTKVLHFNCLGNFGTHELLDLTIFWCFASSCCQPQLPNPEKSGVIHMISRFHGRHSLRDRENNSQRKGSLKTYHLQGGPLLVISRVCNPYTWHYKWVTGVIFLHNNGYISTLAQLVPIKWCDFLNLNQQKPGLFKRQWSRKTELWKKTPRNMFPWETKSCCFNFWTPTFFHGNGIIYLRIYHKHQQTT